MTVTVRYFAAAAEAAGVDSEQMSARTVGDLMSSMAASHPDLTRLLPVCAVLVDGRRSASEAELPSGVTVDVLPPFAGG